LKSNLRNDLNTNRNLAHVYIFSAIAVLILVIACINYMNLMTARASNRESEVGIRKVVGAARLQLISQFLGESILLSVLSVFLALIFARLLLPVFNSLAAKELTFIFYKNPVYLFCLPIIALIIGLISGLYPAFFISSFQPISVIRGIFKSKRKQSVFKINNILVIIQFTVSIILITSTIVIYNQLHFVRNTELGYNKEQLLVLPIFEQEIKSRYEILKTEFLQNPGISGVTATSYIPSESGFHQNVWWEGLPENDWSNMIRWIPVDYDFVRTMNIEIIDGRDFSSKIAGDAGEAYILNESAVEEIGWESALGKEFQIIKRGRIIGVVKDFHFRSLHNEIEPVALYVYPEEYKYLLVRVNPGDIPGSIEFLKTKWEELAPGVPFEYSFLDEDYDRLYKSEIRLGKIFSYAAGLAIFIACLGILGLISFSVRQRSKEIGVRKVLGASVTRIILMLSKELTVWILLANIIALPAAYFAMNRWLQNFAYKINLGIEIFIFSAVLALLIALLTVSYKAIKAANANPVEALRFE